MYGSYGWLRFCQGSFATIPSGARIGPTAIDIWLLVGHARLVVRVIVRSPTVGEEQWEDQCSVIVRLVVATTDRSYDQSCGSAIDFTVNRAIQRPIARSGLVELAPSIFKWHDHCTTCRATA